jgi:hypothetical protein
VANRKSASKRKDTGNWRARYWDRDGKQRSPERRRDAAAQAGLQAGDLIVRYGDARLFAPRELVAESRSGTAGETVRVAIIRIPKQDIVAGNAQDIVEGLSFDPWHSLPDHRSLGSLNRARKVIYEALSKFRHEANDLPRQEPAKIPW